MSKLTKARLTSALCLALAAAMLFGLGVSCARKRRVVSRQTTRAETSDGVTADDSAGTETGEVGRDADHVIVIDPGHGVGDAGYQSEFTEKTEAEITLSFSEKLRDALSERGYTVYLTHDGETIPQSEADNGDGVYTDRERAAFADECEADYFLSVHCNTYAGSGAQDVSGSRVYVSAAAKAGKSEVRLAGEELCAALSGTKLGDDQSSLIVTAENDSYPITTGSDAVSLLLMLGYMSNERDAADITDPAWLSRAAQSAADAVDAYFPAE